MEHCSESRHESRINKKITPFQTEGKTNMKKRGREKLETTKLLASAAQ